ncbi:Signal recognition particle 54 kDa protein [Euphorbia peplus]|nr:Signal recognition particle 54 kDa protein [Euphorbia peplus]
MEWADNRKVETRELGRRISEAIGRMMEASIVDEKVVDLCLKEIALALFQTDLQFKLVRDLQNNVKNRIQNAADQYDIKITLQSIFYELCTILDPGKPTFSPFVKKQINRVIFAGLQGSGKTTACIQFANYYKKQGFRPAIVSADTFRATNFDSLMQNTMAASIHLYGSFLQSQPVAQNAVRGINWFRRHAAILNPYNDLVIIDTSERHTQLPSLIEETRKVSEATKPDLVIFVVDSGIGLAAFHQVKSFKQSFKTGAVIMSRVTHDQKGGEAVSAIATTKTPVMFVGRGEGLQEFEAFHIEPFVSRLLGLGEMPGFKHDVPSDDEQPEFLTNYTLRIYHMLIHLTDKKLPYFGSIIRGYGRNEEEKNVRLRKLGILSSLTTEELDARVENLLSCPFIWRIAKRSCTSVRNVLLVMEDYKMNVAFFKILDRNFHPPCKEFEEVIPGVIVSKRMKPTSEKSNDAYQARLDMLCGLSPHEVEERKKRKEEEFARLRTLYGKGKPLPPIN